jgi:hypothetical protein
MARRLVMGVVLVCTGLLLGVCSVSLYIFSQQREIAAIPMFEREAADTDACHAAELAIAGHRAPAVTAFDSDCVQPIVTRVWTRPGFVIVTRTVKEAESGASAGPLKFSALLDGRGTSRWLIVDVRPAANELALDTVKPRRGGIDLVSDPVAAEQLRK